MTKITARLSTALADRYQIERHLGDGGMATVYLAEDLKHKRKVALVWRVPGQVTWMVSQRFVTLSVTIPRKTLSCRRDPRTGDTLGHSRQTIARRADAPAEIPL